jgi:eukaryotic-like serine/threonine-protein kinase
MSSPRPEEAIVDAALGMPRAERAAFIEEACGGDAQLRVLVEALLQAHQQVAGFNQIPTPAPRAGTLRTSFPLAEKAGDRIGRYKLLQQIG